MEITGFINLLGVRAGIDGLPHRSVGSGCQRRGRGRFAD
jgi:hypothetical protein